MASDSIKPLLREALANLQANQPEAALEILERAKLVREDDADVASYRGIALAKLGRTSEATEALEHSVKIAPTVGRLQYTLGVHYRTMGRKDDAIRCAREAWRLDPKFPGLPELFSELGLDISNEQKETLREKIRRAAAGPPEGAAPKPTHAFPVIEQFASQWTKLGWVIVALTFVGPILFKIHFPMHAPQAGEPAGLGVFGKYVFDSDPMSIFSIFIFITAYGLAAAWTVADVLDRRARVLWFIPMVPFGCLCGLPGVGQAIYMGLGRK